VTLNSAAGLVELFVILVAVATVGGLVFRRIGVPYTVLLVVVGLGGVLVAPGLRVNVPPEVILTVFLPGLVFESGYRLDVGELRHSSGAVAFLAVPGVLITAAVVAVVLSLAAGIPVELGFLVGAMLAATDPAAVIATIKRMRAPERLSTLVEAESVFNDGTAIVVFTVALTALTGGQSVVGAGVALVVTVVVSGSIGIIAGFIAGRVMALTDDHLVELSITLVLAYGTYMLADAWHMSGIIATVVAAITFGIQARRGAMTERAREAVETVWEFAAYLLTAVLFVLIGLVIDIGALGAAIVPIAWGILAVVGSRAFLFYGIVGPANRLLRATEDRLPTGWLHVMIAAGMRGAVSVALALSLPQTVPQRELLVEVTFGITLFTLVVQGLLLDPIVRRSLALDPRALAPDPGA
jgi:CPA1 family monovalent cation:H+ antiporter